MAEKIIIDWGSNTQGFLQGVTQINSGINSVVGTLGVFKNAIFGSFAVQALKNFNNEFREFATTLTQAQKQTGANTTELQVYKKQIEGVGGSLEDVTNLMGKLTAARQKALDDPKSQEGKAFEALGIDRVALNLNQAPELFRMIQQKANEAGSPIAIMGNLMDIFGEKSVKNLAMFNSSFDKTEEKLKNAGKLINEDTISRFNAVDKANNELDLGNALTGGKEAKGKVGTVLSGLWFAAKFLAKTAVNEFKNEALDLSNDDIEKQDLEMGTDLAGVSGGLTPEQRNAIDKKNTENTGKRARLLKDIENIREKNAEKEKNDEEKLNDLVLRRMELKRKIQDLEDSGKGKSVESLSNQSDLERVLGEIYTAKKKVNEANDKLDKERDTKLKEIQKKFGGQYSLSDDSSISTTGGFIGTARSALEGQGERQVGLLERILETLVVIKNGKVMNTTDDSYPSY